jgi:hypothetical protein
MKLIDAEKLARALILKHCISNKYRFSWNMSTASLTKVRHDSLFTDKDYPTIQLSMINVANYDKHQVKTALLYKIAKANAYVNTEYEYSIALKMIETKMGL